jgi:hypothetical protein
VRRYVFLDGGIDFCQAHAKPAHLDGNDFEVAVIFKIKHSVPGIKNKKVSVSKIYDKPPGKGRIGGKGELTINDMKRYFCLLGFFFGFLFFNLLATKR